jgi:hypothetical protein
MNQHEVDFKEMCLKGQNQILSEDTGAIRQFCRDCGIKFNSGKKIG